MKNSEQSMEVPRTLYLDWNVLTGLREGELPELNRLLERQRDDGWLLLPYSAAHVEELQRFFPGPHPSADSEIAERLAWLGSFTGSTYLYHGADVEAPVLRRETPMSVYSTINEVPWADAAIGKILETFTPDHVNEFRRAAQLDPRSLNNIKGQAVLEQLDQVLAPRIAALSGDAENLTLRGMIEQVIKYHPDGGKFGLRHKMAALFTLLNWVGFWPDEKFAGQRRRGSLSDASHATLAAHADALATLDRRFRIKAAAAYEYLGIPTMALGVDDIVDWLEHEA